MLATHRRSMMACRLTKALRSPMPAGDAGQKISRCGILMGAVCLLLLQLTSVQNSWSKTDADYYKLYAHTLVIDYKQFSCLEKLWMKESNWNPLAKNKKSSAFGIPQMLKMVTRDPFEQIDLGLKYITARHGTACNALAYFKTRGHY